MKYYLDITLLPSIDINLYFLWEKVYQQIHLSLVNSKQAHGDIPVGLSFPQYQYHDKCKTLGTKLRLFSADEPILEKMNIKNSLKSFTDYIHITSIREVRTNVNRYVQFSRKQVKSSKARIARRKAKCCNISYDQALLVLDQQGFTEKQTDLPFIHIKSHSSCQKFRLFIVKQQFEKPSVGQFSTYGLSNKATLPDF